jgi:hypothetical protein
VFYDVVNNICEALLTGEAWFKFCVDGAGNGSGDRAPDGHEAGFYTCQLFSSI